MDLSAGTVEGLAPDAGSVAAARKLARPAPWSEAGRDERAVWGLCKGSGAKPYQVQVDLSGPAYKCSCPSRKFPCKHALALLLLAAGGDVPAGERPPWVAEWLESRVERAPRPAPGEPVRDPEAAARRVAEREERVAAGVEDLRLWLRDAVRGGLGAGRLRAWEEWDGFAARLVDAQAPGAAARLRSLGSVAAGRPDGWPERLLSGLGLLHLLCEAHTRADGPLRDDIRALLGWNVARDDVLGRRARAGPLGGAVADGDRAGAPARAADLAVGAGRRSPGAAAGLRAAGCAARAAPAGRQRDHGRTRLLPGRDPAARARGRRPGPARSRGPGASAAAARRRRWTRSRGRSRPTRGSRSGPSRSPRRCRTAATAGRGPRARPTERSRSAAPSRLAGGCSPSPAVAPCRCSGCSTARR